MTLLDGKVVANEILRGIQAEIEKYRARPTLSVILATDRPDSKIYVEKKIKTCREIGIEGKLLQPHHDPSWAVRKYDLLYETIQHESDWYHSNGVLIQSPLPYELEDYKYSFYDCINPLADVDVFTSTNVGMTLQGRPRFLPCTPHGIYKLLRYYGVETAWRKVAIINRSDVVGKPLQSMLIQEKIQIGKDTYHPNATVTICHDHTPHETTKEVCLDSDIIVVAVGKKNFLTADMVRNGQIIIDVGINRDEDGKICGDADFSNIVEKVAAISPVPGGVGPMTVAMLMYNTLQAYKLRHEIWE